MRIKEYVFATILDSCMSEICRANDNKVFDYKDREVVVNYPPLHPNYRVRQEAEKQLKRRARNR